MTKPQASTETIVKKEDEVKAPKPAAPSPKF